jgi:hypothetical protein
MAKQKGPSCKALLVGINDYAPAGPGGPDLRGCVNDVRDMATTLVHLGIVPPMPRDVRILTDSRATRAEILSGLDWLLKGAKGGDRMIFYYSGHGSRVVDTGNEEPDRYDEAICPHDFTGAGMIVDDQLRERLRNVPSGVNLEVIFDSCFSGSATRSEPGVAPGPEGEPLTPRYVDPPVDWGFYADVNPMLPARRLLRVGEGSKEREGTREAHAIGGMTHVLWAACRDNQTSSETAIGGVQRGVFTYFFCRNLRRAGAGVTRLQLDRLVSADLRRSGYPQVPQLEGTRTSLSEVVFC